LKKEGKPVMLKAGEELTEVVAVKRDQRSVTVSAVEEAMELPTAAVKAVT
jgi:hypothetical protein